jgi:23S rRNA (guanosine2251-2'-O)-methyltransferase
MHTTNNKDLIFGTRAVIEALRAGKEINKILLQKGIENSLFTELKKEIKANNVSFQFVPAEKLNSISRKNHQGVIAYISPVNYHKIENLLPGLFEQGLQPVILILDRITDVRNFGAICRTAQCMGVNAVVIPSRGSALVTADAVKTSAGALHTLPVCREDNLKNTITYLKESGLTIIACTEKGVKNIADVDFNIPLAIIMGSEDEGISAEYLKMADQKAKIPMHGNIASLNVSVACGMILYEMQRQRMTKS